MIHKFEVNGKVEFIEADGLTRALIEADRRFGAGNAKYLGIKIK